VAIITGGNVIPPSSSPGGVRPPIYYANGVPTDANIGLPAGTVVNGMLAVDINNGNLYERAAGSWVRRDTL
jgi:hypothetical protein